VLRQVVVAQMLEEEVSSPISPCKVQFLRFETFTNPSIQDVALTICFFMLPPTTLEGVSKLKEKWDRYRVLGKSRQRKKGDGVALFVSPNAEYVSVTVGNHIIILRKADGYASPCGVYTSE
jgi:hypothetical protein